MWAVSNGPARSEVETWPVMASPGLPWDFIRDVINNTLPQVSWVVPLTVGRTSVIPGGSRCGDDRER